VILAAGAVDTPKLLLLSGVGPAAELAAHGIGRVADLPVGENLRDHVANGLLVATEGAPTLYTAERIRHLAQWLVLRRGPLTSNVAEAAAFLRSDPSLPAPDLELIFAPVPFEEEGTVPPSRDGITVAVVLLQPRSTGTVRLRSPDPRDPPIIDPRFLTDPDGHDEAVLLHGVRIARELVAREPLSRYAWGEILPGDDVVDEDGLRAHLRARSQTLYHPVGTCALGSVVERDLRVHGLDGLRVVDASVLPRLPRGHTNWPVVAVAERASDLVREART
jgi:choline dehydrogenase